MKNLKNITLMLAMILSFTSSEAKIESTITETFKVWGNCGMCEKTIEKSLKVKGVSKADWNQETKMITVVFNPKKITLAEIHKKIAAVGYDTELETAKDETYNALHGCCKYDRKKK